MRRFISVIQNHFSRRFIRERVYWLLHSLGQRSVVITLAALTVCLGLATFVVLSAGTTFYTALEPLVLFLNTITIVLFLLALVLRLTPLFRAYKKKQAGTRLHVRLVALFSVVSIIPTLVVGGFAALFFHYGIQIWFSDRVNMALTEALKTSHGYLAEHNASIRTDAFSMANYIIGVQNELTLSGIDLFEDHNTLSQILDSQATIRGLTEAIIYDPITHRVVAAGGLMSHTGTQNDLPPAAATLMAQSNDIAVLDSPNRRVVRAVVELSQTPALMLVITRMVDPTILEHMYRTEKVVTDYKHLNKNKQRIQFTFVMIFMLVALLVLLVAVLIGLALADQIARPLELLSGAAKKVSEGDLSIYVPETGREDEIASLLRTFNNMTEQLASQRAELMVAYSQIDERRRFTEAVLSGVSAGVIGLDEEQKIKLHNKAACILLQIDLSETIGAPLERYVPEFTEVLIEAKKASHQDQDLTREIQIGSAANQKTLLVRIGAEWRENIIDGYVITFDDLTALQQAQRQAAWAGVARRIAHEIKNPLTPIQLAAERLKRRFLKEITSDPETFSHCAETIVRHVGNIGRMVDEFSSFARMPQPVMQDENLALIAREVILLQQNAHPDICYTLELPYGEISAWCDRHLISQALINLLQNAADAIAMRDKAENANNSPQTGEIKVRLMENVQNITVSVTDNGIGLPTHDRGRLIEPYVTYKAKGTGLGLAIVKKIMEDHGGTLYLEDRIEEKGAVITLVLPTRNSCRINEKSNEKSSTISL